MSVRPSVTMSVGVSVGNDRKFQKMVDSMEDVVERDGRSGDPRNNVLDISP